jgi:hypothetical protein
MDVVSAAGTTGLQMFTADGLVLYMPMPISTVCWVASCGKVALFCAGDGTLVLLDTNADRALEVRPLGVRPRAISVSDQTVAFITRDNVLHMLRVHEEDVDGRLLSGSAEWLLGDLSLSQLPETLS